MFNQVKIVKRLTQNFVRSDFLLYFPVTVHVVYDGATNIEFAFMTRSK